MTPAKTKYTAVTATPYSHPSNVDSRKLKTTSINITRHSLLLAAPNTLRFRQKKNEVKRSQTKPIGYLKGDRLLCGPVI